MSHAERILAVLMLAFAGCSTFQSDLNPQRLEVGRTSREQVVNDYGNPAGIDTITGPGIPAVTSLFQYGFTHPKRPEMFRGIWQVPQSNLVIEILNDTLHGYLYNKSGETSPTAFNKHLRWKIAIGRTTKTDVLALLGEPSGKILLPTSLLDHPALKHLRHVIPTNAREAWCYYYDYPYFKAGVRRSFEYYRFLAVYFNGKGIVTDKFFGESDRTEPAVTRTFVP